MEFSISYNPWLSFKNSYEWKTCSRHLCCICVRGGRTRINAVTLGKNKQNHTTLISHRLHSYALYYTVVHRISVYCIYCIISYCFSYCAHSLTTCCHKNQSLVTYSKIFICLSKKDLSVKVKKWQQRFNSRVKWLAINVQLHKYYSRTVIRNQDTEVKNKHLSNQPNTMHFSAMQYNALQ